MQQTFGKYRLVDRLAFGGMAEVFLATVHGEAGFSKPVVIKRLHPRLSEDHEFTRMLIDEARITSQLTHTNICQVLDLGQVAGSYFIAMEFVPGEDLRTVQDHYRRQRLYMPVQVAVYVVTELLAGLDYAHRKEDADGEPLGVIHRDISPQNVLVSYEGEVKVIDFGIAKARQRLVQTQAGVIKGKFRYMSPEQATGGKVDHRTDLFAAAVVLYELLRGEPHSLEMPDTEVLKRMRDADFDPLERAAKEVPPELLALLSRALHKSPRKRFQTAGEFRQALVALQPKLPPVFRGQRAPFGREELALLMKQVFPLERRRKRSGSSLHGAVAAPGVSEPRRADVCTSAAAAVAQDPVHQSSPESAMAAASGRLLRETTNPIIKDEPETSSRARSPSPAAGRGAGRSETVVGEPSAEALAADAAETSAWPADDPAKVAEPRRSGRGRVGHAAGVFSRNEPPQPEVRKQATDMGWEDEDPSYAPHPPAGSRRSPRRRPPAGADRGGSTRIEAPSVASAADRGRSTGGAGWLVILLVVAALVGAAFYLGKYGIPDSVRELWESQQAGGGEDEIDLDELPEDVDPAPEPRQRAYGRVRIESVPSGAKVVICGKRPPRPTPVTVRLPRGRRCQLRLELAGHEAYSASVRVRAGKRLQVHRAELKPTPKSRDEPAAVRHGRLLVTGIRVGTVFVNGEAVGQTPRLELRLPPGRYQVFVKFSSIGVQTGIRTVQVKAGRTQKLHFDPTM